MEIISRARNSKAVIAGVIEGSMQRCRVMSFWWLLEQASELFCARGESAWTTTRCPFLLDTISPIHLPRHGTRTVGPVGAASAKTARLGHERRQSGAADLPPRL